MSVDEVISQKDLICFAPGVAIAEPKKKAPAYDKVNKPKSYVQTDAPTTLVIYNQNTELSYDCRAFDF